MTASPLSHRSMLLGITIFALAGGALVYRTGQGKASRSEQLAVRDLESAAQAEPARSEALGGFLSLGDLRLDSGAVIDAASSPIESYLQGHVPDSGHARVRSVGSIELAFEPGSAPTVVVGDAQATPGSEVLIQKGSFVTGSIVPSEEFVHLPALPPIELKGSRDWQLTRGDQGTEQPQQTYGRVHITGNATWFLIGPLDLQLRSLEVSERATLVLDASQGPIQIRIAERFQMGSGTRLQGMPGDLGRVGIFVGQGQASFADSLARVRSREEERAQAMRDRLAGLPARPDDDGNAPRLDLRCSGEFYGLIYAPFSPITLPASLGFRGALTGASIRLEPNAHATCDPAALKVWEAWRPKGD